jgi:signal transduction histidine kinase
MKLFFSTILLIITSNLFAAKVLTVKDFSNAVNIEGQNIDVFEDKKQSYNISQLSLDQFSYLFHTSTSQEPLFYNLNANYWVRFRIFNANALNEFTAILELAGINYKNVVYYYSTDGMHYQSYLNDVDQSFNHRNIKHRNHLLLLKLKPQQLNYVFIKFNVSKPLKGVFTLQSYRSFLTHSNTNYFILAIFYGIIVSMFLYNLFVYITIQDKAYLYYVGYLFFIALYWLSQDGLGFQYVWSYWPNLNDHIKEFSELGTILFVLLYAHQFLKPKLIDKLFDYIILVLLFFRVCVFVLGVFLFPSLVNTPFYDILILFYVYGLAIYTYVKGFNPARFFILAFTMLFVGYALTSLVNIGFFRGVAYLNYAVYIGVTLEMILLSFSLADRIKDLVKEREIAREKYIQELKEKEELKDGLNRILEEKVQERTQEIVEKNKQLDGLIYKASHDIKGPLKSIIGLTTLGKMDIQDAAALEYFEHILISTKRLDAVISELLNIAKVNELKPKHEKIDLPFMINEIVSSLENSEGFNRFQVDVQFHQDRDFYSDDRLLYSVFQNLIENAYKYRDLEKEHCRLVINIAVSKDEAVFVFADNGLGIEENVKEKVFDMFFKANESSNGTGLGLYLVKASIQKLGGQIELFSELGQGSTFKIKI